MKQFFSRTAKDSLRGSGSDGRKPRLSVLQKQEVVEALLEGPRQSGYATEVWTLPRVRALIRQRTGESYHESHVSRLMHSLGFSCQRPERRAIERDEKKIKQWKCVQWPAIKKSPAPAMSDCLCGRVGTEHPTPPGTHLGTAGTDTGAPGHNASTWENETYQKHIVTGIRWALKLIDGPAQPYAATSSQEALKSIAATAATTLNKDAAALEAKALSKAKADPKWASALAAVADTYRALPNPDPKKESAEKVAQATAAKQALLEKLVGEIEK